MTPEGRNVEDFQIEPLPNLGRASAKFGLDEKPIELRSIGQPRAAVPTLVLIG
jgi:hypothetical protein